MKIAGLQKVSLLDYPGRIAASAFLAGCNLDCGYCHNRWMIDAAHVREAVTVPALLDWLAGRVGLLDGVCISGGEPTLQADLPELLRDIRALGFLTKLDTNGTRPETLAGVLDAGLVDYVAMDIKAPLDERYAAVTGRECDLAALRASMALLRGWDPSGQRYEFRTTAEPHTDPAALEAIASEIMAQELWALQPYVPPRESVAEARVSEALEVDDLVRAAVELRSLVPRVIVRGE
ncbi:MAG: anaerobic ribonucleoside-triphosphate reductase activating protein [Chloroflexi bacterium]|nr:anaerobic ribonucleoside-triphosphate reductase activating protein [Chloroflexota bacterium]